MTNTLQVRCAIYTRKSSEEGLEQSFNSLQAQREACEAYIKSQKHEGWHPLSTHYDDGGFSGGSMERPALQELLEDIAAGKVNVVVVYKVDRLTRSLLDFSKIIESFDAQNVSFVSVTQQFNTTTSMGRLTLNVLLSFAQFEREVTGERIRDKIAASKKKGMWMGGRVPLGYDLRDRKLIVNSAEAETIRLIFAQYAQLGCVSQLKEYLDRRKIFSKPRASTDGQKSGGESFSRGALYQILKNQIYIGRIPHKMESFPGQHEAIIPSDLWIKVSELLRGNDRGQRKRGRKSATSLLTGILFDKEGNRYTPTHAVKGGMRYRYYTSQAVIRKDRTPSDHARIPAAEIETAVEQRFLQWLKAPEELAKLLSGVAPHGELRKLLSASAEFVEGWNDLKRIKRSEILCQILRRVAVGGTELEVTIALPNALQIIMGEHEMGEHEATVEPSANYRRATVLLTIPFTTPNHRRGLRIISGLPQSRNSETRPLIKAIARAHSWMDRVISGEIVSKEQIGERMKVTSSYVSRIFRLVSLSPDVVEQIVTEGETIVTRGRFAARTPPLSWADQQR